MNIQQATFGAGCFFSAATFIVYLITIVVGEADCQHCDMPEESFVTPVAEIKINRMI